MSILYPVNEKLMLRKARDARIIRMARAFAARGQRMYLLVGKSAKKDVEICKYYGVPPSANLRILQVPILRGNGSIRITVNEVFLWSAFWKARGIARKEPLAVLYFSVLEVADFFLKRRKYFPQTKFIYEQHELALYPENTNPSSGQLREDLLERRVLGGLDGVLTTTEAIRRVIAERFPNLPSITIPLGMEAPLQSPGLAGGKGERIKIAYIGQLYDAQGVEGLIRAMAFLPQVDVHIIGGTASEVEGLRKRAREERMEGRVFLHGFVEPGKVADLTCDMDIFVVPARNTPRMNYVAHIKIYEYMAARRPIVATRLKSVTEELEDGKTGILVEPDDPQALAAGILRLIRNPELGRQIAERAYAQSAKYHWENRADRILRFIDQVPKRSDQ